MKIIIVRDLKTLPIITNLIKIIQATYIRQPFNKLMDDHEVENSNWCAPIFLPHHLSTIHCFWSFPQISPIYLKYHFDNTWISWYPIGCFQVIADIIKKVFLSVYPGKQSNIASQYQNVAYGLNGISFYIGFILGKLLMKVGAIL